MIEPSGYSHCAYAESLSEFGTARALQNCGGWILERPIFSSPHRDATGCYPLFMCQHWDELESDLNGLDGLVSLSIVADPFGNYDLGYLRRCFRDVVRPFKTHYVVDLTRGRGRISAHHRRNLRRALRLSVVVTCDLPMNVEQVWLSLYDGLVSRRAVSGMAAFSHRALQQQLAVPGAIVFQALHSSIPVGMHTWYIDHGVAYYHLGACNDLGYTTGASFALMDFALDYFSEHNVSWLDLGGSAGLADDESTGLARFKRGWATDTRTAYFCGSILNKDAWVELLRGHEYDSCKYFPSYRATPLISE